MNTKINPGELALAQIGVSPILKDSMPVVGVERLREMAAIPDRIERLANKVTLGSLQYTPYTHEHAYTALLKKLSKKITAADLQAITAQFPDESSDIASGFIVALQEAFADLKAIFPVSVYRTFAGPKNLEPSRQKQGAFLNVLDVVNDPLRVFPLIAAGALLRSQGAIVRRVYPTLSAAIDEALYAATARRRGASSEDNPYQLPPLAEVGVSVWLGKPRQNLRPRQAPAQPPQLPKSKLPQLDETATQAATRGTPQPT
jgi:hypothetical protein